LTQLHQRVALQKLRHLQRVAAVLAHAQVQRFGALQDQPGVQRRQAAPKVRLTSMRAFMV
jgi:hypothetical protein